VQHGGRDQSSGTEPSLIKVEGDHEKDADDHENVDVRHFPADYGPLTFAEESNERNTRSEPRPENARLFG
jgi:hypothetical protein